MTKTYSYQHLATGNMIASMWGGEASILPSFPSLTFQPTLFLAFKHRPDAKEVVIHAIFLLITTSIPAWVLALAIATCRASCTG